MQRRAIALSAGKRRRSTGRSQCVTASGRDSGALYAVARLQGRRPASARIAF